MPAATTRSTPQKNKSPMPASGPIRLDLMALIELTSKSSDSLFCFSIEAVSPMMKLDIGTVVLK